VICAAARFSSRWAIWEVPGIASIRDVRDADVTDLARLLRLDEEPQRLRERDRGIGAVELVEVDPLDAQAPQAALERGAQMVAAAVGVPLPRAAAREAALGRDNNAVVGRQRLRDQLLADVRTIGIGGVDEVDTELDGAAQKGDGAGGVGRRAPHAGPGDPHRAIAQAMDLEVTDRDATGATQRIGR
jgi:hypothetical protein